MKISDRKYQAPLPDADWIVSADDVVHTQLCLSLSKHVPDWPGATDDQLYQVAKEIIDALDNRPRAKL